MIRHAPASEFPEFSRPADVAAELGVLEARVEAMEGGYDEHEIFREQIRGAMAIASAVHTQEVIGPRDRFWQDISSVVRLAHPFSVDMQYGTAHARWAFVDTTATEERPNRARSAMTVEASLRLDDPFQPEAKAIGEALKYVAEPVTYPRLKIPEAPLDASARKVGFNQYRFDADQLTLRAAEAVVDQTRSLRTHLYERFDFTREWSGQQRYGIGVAYAEVKQRDEWGGLDETADWLKLRYNVDAAYDNDVLRIMDETLREHGVRTVQQTYDFLVNQYIVPEKAKLAATQRVAEWLQQPQITWVTPRSLGASTERP